jgi:hypothetical protein
LETRKIVFKVKNWSRHSKNLEVLVLKENEATDMIKFKFLLPSRCFPSPISGKHLKNIISGIENEETTTSQH